MAKTQYMVKKINLSHIKDINDYWDKVKKANIYYCNVLDELREYCGGKLHRQRNGYAGINGDIEYVAERIR